jgi:hypothetical protein
MKQIIAFGNLLANLPLWVRVLAIVLLLGLLFVSIAYVWGLRPEAVKKVIQADIPRSRDPREWLKFVSRFGWKGKATVTILSLALVGLLVLPLLFSNFGFVATFLGRNQVRAISSHLFVEHYQNYNYLFLQEVTARNYSQVEDSLKFQNISGGPLTHFRILTFLFTDFANPADFYHFYSIDTGTQYIALDVFDVGLLKSEESYTLRIKDVYDRLLERTDVTDNELNALLFPRIGEPLSCDFRKSRQASNQAYSRKPNLHNKFVVPHPNFRNVALDAMCGFPIKLIVNYHSGTSQVSNVLVGGTFYYGKSQDKKIVPYPESVASFVKPRFSLVREKSGAEDEIVNMDVEISGRNFMRIPFQPDPSILAWYFVVEPEGDEQLDQQLSLTVDNGFEARQTSRAQMLLKSGQVEEAKQTLDGLLNLSPGYEQARSLRAQISD